MESTSRITLTHLACAIRKVRSRDLKEKEALADEIHREQPNLLASVLAQATLGADPRDVEWLLGILLVCYQSMKESGWRWPVITEEDQERELKRWIGAVNFSEYESGSTRARAHDQYVSQHPEQPLLAFVLHEANQRLQAIAPRKSDPELEKFLTMATVNLVNCIAFTAAAARAPAPQDP